MPIDPISLHTRVLLSETPDPVSEQVRAMFLRMFPVKEPEWQKRLREKDD